MLRRGREMARHHIELLGDLTALDGNSLALFAERVGANHQRLEAHLEPVYGLDRAVDEDRDRDHGRRYQHKRQGDDYHDPEKGIVWVHLRSTANGYIVFSGL